MAPRTKRNDSVSAQIKKAKQSGEVIEPPAGYTLDTEAEKRLWAQVVASRPKDTWRIFDLIQLHKYVKLESLYLDNFVELKRDGLTDINAKGTTVESANLRANSTLIRDQLSIIRSLSLGVSADKARTMNDNGEKAHEKIPTNKSTVKLLNI